MVAMPISDISCGAKHPSLAFITIECHRFVSDATRASGSVPTRTSVSLDFPPSVMPMVSFVMVQSDVFAIAYGRNSDNLKSSVILEPPLCMIHHYSRYVGIEAISSRIELV